MYSGNQTTIDFQVHLFGKPKNNNELVTVTFLPAPDDTGIILRRPEIGKDVKINFDNVFVEDDGLHTKLVRDIEQLLVAVWACKIDNMIIEVNGDSFPYLDGCSEQISFILTTAKIKQLSSVRKVVSPQICIKNETLTLKPSTSFAVLSNDFTFDNSIHPYKNWLAHVKKEDKEYPILLIVSMLFVGGFSLLDIKLHKYDYEAIYSIIKTLFNE
ncbi:MAG: hypothetical protein Ta2D_08480 [Rickettsiales bacterium]|nr:MAG: hypothetical protein Ta2D_08480 [Rickettsiales bacterium]